MLIVFIINKIMSCKNTGQFQKFSVLLSAVLQLFVFMSKDLKDFSTFPLTPEKTGQK